MHGVTFIFDLNEAEGIDISMKISKDKIQKFVYEEVALFDALVLFVFGLIGWITKHFELCTIGFMFIVQDISTMNVYDICYGRSYYSDKRKNYRFSSRQECSPKYCKALFKRAHFNIRRVPKVAVQQMYVSVFIAFLFDVLILLVLMTGADRVFVSVLFVCYMYVYLAIALFFIIKVTIIRWFG